MINHRDEIQKHLFTASNFLIDEKPFVIKQLIKDPSNYLNWDDVEQCINNPVFYNFDLISTKTHEKIEIPSYKKAWVQHKLVQDKKFIVEKFHQGNTLVINNYGFHNLYTNDLLKLIESIFYTESAMHVYCGLSGAESFKIHEDIPSNFIFQVEGQTEWTVYNNRSSSIVATGYHPTPTDLEKFSVALKVLLQPGDFLYIPARTYHLAEPKEKRLSISIPCWPKYNEPKEHSIDRNYYRIANF